MTSANIELQNVEELWVRFKEERASDPGLRVQDFAARFPEHAEDIHRIFPLMDELDSFADSTGASLLDVAIPEKIGGYPILRQIGIGGMGVVYEAECEVLRERIAIKVISSERLDPQNIRRFENEARSVARLHHNNIVPIYEFGSEGEHRFYTMRLVDGPNLSDVVRLANPSNRPVDQLEWEEDAAAIDQWTRLGKNWTRIADVGIQATAALAHAHDHGVLHRDIKPANLIVESSGKVWITDFGLAKQTLDDPSLTGMYQAVGTPRYMAPEQLQGLADARSDLFSLGLTLAELCIGRKLDAKQRQLLTSGDASELGLHRVPGALVQVISKSTNADPNLRYQNALQMHEELREFVRIQKRKQQRSRIQAASALVASVAAVLLVVLTLATQIISERGQRAIPFRTAEDSSVAGSVPTHCGPSDRLRLAGPDGSRFVIDQENRELRFREPPNYEVPTDANMDNVYEVSINEVAFTVSVDNVNEPPEFDEYLFQDDGKTIALPGERVTDAWSLGIHDDTNSVFDGLCVTVTGGTHGDWLRMTPPGVFVLDSRAVAPNRSGPIEFQVTVTDESYICYGRLQQMSDGSIRFLKESVQAGGVIHEEVISENCMIRRDIIDLATCDGRTFYHIHRDGVGTASLYESVLVDGRFQSKRLSDDCGIAQNAVGLATADGKTFQFALRKRGDLTSLAVYQAELQPDGTFTHQLLSADGRLPHTIEGLGWLDSTRFSHIRKLPSGERSFYFSFWQKDHFENMPLHQTDSQYSGPSRGQACWIQRSDDSQSVTRQICIRLSPDVSRQASR